MTHDPARLVDSAFVLVSSIEDTLIKRTRERMRWRQWDEALYTIEHVELLVKQLRDRVTELKQQLEEAP